MSVDCPVFLLFEGLNFALAVNNQPQRNGLHAPGRESAANFVPQQGRDLISHKAVEHAPCLLRVDKIAVDIARMLESFLHSPLGDLVESYTSDALAFFIILIFFLLLLFTRTVAKFFRKMRGNGFPFAVRVRRQVNLVGGDSELLQFGNDFFFARDDDVLGIKVVFDIDAQIALGQVFHVAKRGLDGISLTQIFLDGLRLGRRFDDD